MTRFIVNKCISEKFFKEEYAEILLYGGQKLNFFLFNFLLIQLIGLLFGSWSLSVIYCIVYLSISPLTGSFHEKTRFRCAIKTLIAFTSYCIITKLCANNLMSITYLIILFVGYLLVILHWTPIKHKNKVWSYKAEKNNPIISIFLSLAYGFIALSCYQTFYFYSMSIMFAMLMNGVLIVLGYFLNEQE